MRQLYKKSTARIPTLLLCVCLASGFSTTGLAQTFSGAQAAGGTGDDAGIAIAADAAGNTYVAGHFSDTVTFAPGQTRTALTGGSDMFVAKYNPAGNLVWLQQAGGVDDNDLAHGIAVDAAGNSYVTGWIQGGAASFSQLPTAGSPTVSITGQGFVAKYDSAGALQWVRAIAAADNPIGFAVATDTAGNSIYVTGTFGSGLTNFGNGYVFTAEMNDIFLAKYDSSGNTTWVTAIGGTGNEQGRGVAVDGAGNPHVAGFFHGTVAFGTTTLTASSSFSDAFVTKFDSTSGNVLWAKAAKGQLGSGIAVDGAGNSYLSGGAVAKFDGNPSNPNPLWYAGAVGNFYSTGVAIDSAGNSYVAGQFSGTVNFFPPTPVLPPACVSMLCMTGSVTAPGNTIGFFVAKYNTSGQLAYFQQGGSTGNSTHSFGGIAISGANFFVTGEFSGTASFPVTSPVSTFTSAGGFDIFRAGYTGTAGVTHFAVTAPTTATAGTPFSFTVTALDQSNNIVTNYTGTVNFTSSDTNAILPSNSTLTNGTGQFSATLRSAGNNRTITAADANITSIAGTSNPITVSSGPATGFGFSPLPQSILAGTQINNVTVTALDAFGNIVTGYAGLIVLGGTDGQMSVGCATPLANGSQTFCVTLRTNGPQRLQATNAPFNASIISDSPPINVIPGSAVGLVFFSPLSVTGGTPFTFSVAARDAHNNNAPSYTGTVHFTSNDPNAILPPDSTLTNGLGSFSAVLNTAGTKTITATDGLLSPVSVSIAVNGSAAPTPAGGNVPVQPIDPASGAPQPISLTFTNVSPPGGGTTAVQTQMSPPANFSLNGVAYNITTTASFTAPVTVCFTGSFTSSDVILHFENGAWVTLQNQVRTPAGPGPYTKICAETNTLSPFGVFTPVNSNNPPSANAGANQTLEATSPAGASVSLSGTGSDQDNDPLTFSWSGPCGTASGANVTLTCPLGVSAMTLTVSDGRGGSATAGVQITVRDTTPPSIVCALPDTAWHSTDVVIACSASDVVGLANPADANFMLTTNIPAGTETAAATTGSRAVCDGSGNCATAGPIGPIKVDKKAPVVEFVAPVNNATYILNQQVPANFSCKDGGAGVANCNAPVANGANIDTGSVGTKTFKVTTSDTVGNTSETTVSYRVIFASSGRCLGAPGHAILSPIAQNGLSIFRKGATVPAKFRVCDARGNSIGTPGVVSSFSLIQVTSGVAGDIVGLDGPSLVPSTEFRWDPSERQWIYNIGTRSFSSGNTHHFRISLSDGTNIEFSFGLK